MKTWKDVIFLIDSERSALKAEVDLQVGLLDFARQSDTRSELIGQGNKAQDALHKFRIQLNMARAAISVKREVEQLEYRWSGLLEMVEMSDLYTQRDDVLAALRREIRFVEEEIKSFYVKAGVDYDQYVK